jgi:hypothetical protein
LSFGDALVTSGSSLQSWWKTGGRLRAALDSRAGKPVKIIDIFSGICFWQ